LDQIYIGKTKMHVNMPWYRKNKVEYAEKKNEKEEPLFEQRKGKAIMMEEEGVSKNSYTRVVNEENMMGSNPWKSKQKESMRVRMGREVDIFVE